MRGAGGARSLRATESLQQLAHGAIAAAVVLAAGAPPSSWRQVIVATLLGPVPQLYREHGQHGWRIGWLGNRDMRAAYSGALAMGGVLCAWYVLA